MSKRFGLCATQAKIIQQSHHTKQSLLIIRLSNQIEFNINFEDQNKFFRVGDLVRVVYEAKTKQVHAVLNHRSKQLYLRPQLVSLHSKGLGHSFSRFCYLFLSWFILILGMTIMHQLISYWDIFWGSIQDRFLLIFFASIAISLAVFILTEKNDQSTLLAEVLDHLDFPQITSTQLKHFTLTNSYFEFQKGFFDVNVLMTMLSQQSKDDVQATLQQLLNSKNKFGLIESEAEKFKLHQTQGSISALGIKKILASAEHTDSFSLIQFHLNGLALYGYVDEFHLKNKMPVTVIYSKLNDQQGRYMWAISDQKRYVYLDEDVLIDLLYRIKDRLLNYRDSSIAALTIISVIAVFWAFYF